MTLHRELEVDEGVISNSNGFEKGTIFDAAGGSDTKRRIKEKTKVFHNELLQLFQTLHFNKLHVWERKGRDVDGLEIVKVDEGQLWQIHLLTTMRRTNKTLNRFGDSFRIEWFQAAVIETDIFLRDVFSPARSVYFSWDKKGVTFNRQAPNG